MDRYVLEHQYHKPGYSCAQSVAGAFANLPGWEPERLFAADGRFGGGVGGSHEELCEAVSGGLLVLGLLFPHTKTFHQRFFETFGHTRCGVNEKTTAAARLGLTSHCDIMVVTAVELLEALLQNRRLRQLAFKK